MTHHDDALAAAMMASATVERRRARARDGYHPGGLPQTARKGPVVRKQTPAGVKARQLVAAEPTLTPRELARLSGVAESTARDIVREAREARA